MTDSNLSDYQSVNEPESMQGSVMQSFKESKMSSHRKFLDGIIQRQIQEKDGRVKYKQGELRRLIEVCHYALTLDQTLMELDCQLGQMFIFGDLYGHYKNLWALMRAAGFPPGPNRHYLFLGNYVTRGNRGVETMCCLMAIKAAYPDHVTLLRGNHDCDMMGQTYNVSTQWCKKENDKDSLWGQLCEQVFEWLPLACVINKSIFCCHGGLSRGLTTVNGLQTLHHINRPLDVPQSGLITDLLWACPSELPGWETDVNMMTEKFGPDVITDFLANNPPLQLIVRGYQVHSKGFVFYPNEKVLTLFSAANWCGDFNNAAGMLKITFNDNDEVHPFKLQCMSYKIVPEPEEQPEEQLSVSNSQDKQPE